MAGCNGIVPVHAVVGGVGDGENWASLLTMLVTKDRDNFFFAFNRRFVVGSAIVIRFRDEDQGMVTVDCVIGAIVNRGDWFEVHAVRCDCTELLKIAA